MDLYHLYILLNIKGRLNRKIQADVYPQAIKSSINHLGDQGYLIKLFDDKFFYMISDKGIDRTKVYEQKPNWSIEEHLDLRPTTLPEIRLRKVRKSLENFPDNYLYSCEACLVYHLNNHVQSNKK